MLHDRGRVGEPCPLLDERIDVLTGCSVAGQSVLVGDGRVVGESIGLTSVHLFRV